MKVKREEAVPITLELYLHHQVIRGDFQSELDKRPIDLLNAAVNSVITLSDAWSASLYAEAPPIRLGTVRVQRAQILLVIPQNPPPLPRRLFRVGFIEKRQVHAALGVGPFVLTGTAHVGAHELASIRGLENDTSGRLFIPVTQAAVRSQHALAWSLEAELLFLNRAAISYGRPLETA
jgi:hypothetical protein